jgi:hypothetical protein
MPNNVMHTNSAMTSGFYSKITGAESVIANRWPIGPHHAAT